MKALNGILHYLFIISDLPVIMSYLSSAINLLKGHAVYFLVDLVWGGSRVGSFHTLQEVPGFGGFAGKWTETNKLIRMKYQTETEFKKF